MAKKSRCSRPTTTSSDAGNDARTTSHQVSRGLVHACPKSLKLSATAPNLHSQQKKLGTSWFSRRLWQQNTRCVMDAVHEAPLRHHGGTSWKHCWVFLSTFGTMQPSCRLSFLPAWVSA